MGRASIVVSTGFEVNQIWLQIGYKKFLDAVESLYYLDCVYEKRIESAVYYKKSKTSTRVGIRSVVIGQRHLSPKGQNDLA